MTGERPETRAELSRQDASTPENLPDEETISKAISELPREGQLHVLSSIQEISPYESPIQKQINSRHIDKIIDSSEKDAQRSYHLKLTSVGAMLFLILMVLVYSGWTKDRELSERIITAGLGFLAGAGTTSFLANKKD